MFEWCILKSVQNENTSLSSFIFWRDIRGLSGCTSACGISVNENTPIYGLVVSWTIRIPKYFMDSYKFIHRFGFKSHFFRAVYLSIYIDSTIEEIRVF